MKRSQMLQVIKDALYCHLPGYRECPDYIAETVLQGVEGGNQFGIGMKPPSYEGLLANGKKYCHETDCGRDTGCFSEWEPE